MTAFDRVIGFTLRDLHRPGMNIGRAAKWTWLAPVPVHAFGVKNAVVGLPCIVFG
jgi:hypothetical protein